MVQYAPTVEASTGETFFGLTRCHARFARLELQQHTNPRTHRDADGHQSFVASACRLEEVPHANAYSIRAGGLPNPLSESRLPRVRAAQHL